MVCHLLLDPQCRIEGLRFGVIPRITPISGPCEIAWIFDSRLTAEQGESMGTTATTTKGHAAPSRLGSPDGLRRRLKACIQVVDEALWLSSPSAAEAFTDTLCDALRFEDADRLRVRCGVARDNGSGLRLMCKVELAGDRAIDGPVGSAWSWWSPLVESPEDLIIEVRRALRQRHHRLATARQGTSIAAGRTDKARGPGHGTWSTELWDLGRSDQSEGFCRNRRARWTSYAAPTRPLRPRSPR